MNKAHVTGLGTWFPDEVRTNDAWPAEFVARGRSDSDRTLVDIPRADDEAGRISLEFLSAESSDPFLGSSERRVAPDSMSACDAQIEAARVALDDAGLAADKLDFVISWDVVPDRVSPPGANRTADRLGARRAVAFGVETACASALTQLMVARGLIESGQARHVLLTQTHLMTRAFPMMHPAAPGIGDGASALVVSAEPRWPILGTHGRTHGQYYDAVAWVRGKDCDTPWWKSGPDYYLGSLRAEAAKELMKETVAFGALTIRELMAKVGYDVERIALLASVQPRGWIPSAIARCMRLSDDVVECTYAQYAHLGVCGPIVNWSSARAKGNVQPGGLVALYAQGAGFTRAAALIETPPGT